MVQRATALLAAGDTATPLRALIYLAITQREDGGFYQNFWIDGRPYWTGVQLDEVSFPIIAGVAAVEGQRAGRFRSVHHGVARLRLPDPRRPGDGRRSAGRRAAATRPRRWRRNIAGLICAAEIARGSRRQAHGRLRRARMPTSWSRTSRRGRSRIRARWFRASPGTTSASIPRRATAARCGDEDPDTGELIAGQSEAR